MGMAQVTDGNKAAHDRGRGELKGSILSACRPKVRQAPGAQQFSFCRETRISQGGLDARATGASDFPDASGASSPPLRGAWWAKARGRTRRERKRRAGAHRSPPYQTEPRVRLRSGGQPHRNDPQRDRHPLHLRRRRLARATKPDGTVYSYGINGLGQRVGKASPALSTGGRVYVYDEAGHLLGEYDRTGARIWEHVYLGDTPVAVIGAAGVVHYVLSDPLNTPRQIVNAAYQLRWRWDPADPFGDNAADTNPQGLGGFGYNL
jgi:uncharacterized protein RhaS with RHS repeats